MILVVAGGEGDAGFGAFRGMDAEDERHMDVFKASPELASPSPHATVLKQNHLSE